MNDSTIAFERLSPQMGRVTFANPPVNLVVGETVSALAELVRELSSDDDLRVVVFRSGVDDFFINHFDLARLDEFPPHDPVSGEPVWTRMVVALSQAPFISIGSIRGRTRGGGNELALALDLRYASIEKAIFGQPEVGTTIVPGGGATERLPVLIGRDRALEVILTSADYDATTAERWGWVTRALPDDELDGYVMCIAERLASFDRNALRLAKSMVNRVSLPSESNLRSAYSEFERSTRQDAFSARLSGLLALSDEQLIELEYRLGAALGAQSARSAN